MKQNKQLLIGCLLLFLGVLGIERLLFASWMPIFALLNPLLVMAIWIANDRLNQPRQLAIHQDANAIEDLLMQIDHEVQNPIAALKICLESMDDEGYTPAVAKSMHASLERLESVNRLYMRLLCLNTVEAIPMQAADFSELLRRALIDGSPKSPLDNTQLVVRIPEEPIHVMCHEQLLFESLKYLFDYALYAHTGKSQLFISLAKHHSYLTLTIEQHGNIPTMTKDLLAQQVFSFQQPPTAIKKPLGPTGLALSLSKCVIEHHRGLIDYQYCGHKTTRYHVTLPLEITH